MRAWIVLVFLPLAGCLGSETPDADAGDPACARGVCPVIPEEHADWVLPDGAQALWSIDASVGSIRALTRYTDGWAWIADRDGLWLDVLQADQIVSTAVPGDDIRKGALVANDGRLWFATSGEPGSLHRWNGSLASWPLDGDGLAVHGARGDAVLVGSSGGPILWQAGAATSLDGASGAIGPRGILMISDNRSEAFRLDAHSLQRHVVVARDEADLVAAYADGGFAITYDDGTDIRILHVDADDHSVTDLGPGDAPVFTPRGYFFVGKLEGVSPDVQFHDDELNNTASVFFLRPRTVWTADGNGVAWIEPPSTDPRFLEAPNPTPFAGVLYARGFAG